MNPNDALKLFAEFFDYDHPAGYLIAPADDDYVAHWYLNVHPDNRGELEVRLEDSNGNKETFVWELTLA